MLSRNQVYVLLALLVLAALSFLVLGNYYVSLAAVVGMLAVGVVAITRNRSAATDHPAR